MCVETWYLSRIFWITVITFNFVDTGFVTNTINNNELLLQEIVNVTKFLFTTFLSRVPNEGDKKLLSHFFVTWYTIR